MKNKRRYIFLALAVLVVGISILIMNYSRTTTLSQQNDTEGFSQAYFAGGCFWCVESDFEKLTGVQEVISGYMGGEQDNPTYENHGDHREAVEVFYDPNIVSYTNLVEYFFRHHDPTDPGGSFYDRGHSYTSAIYPQNEQEEEIAMDVIKGLNSQKVFSDSIVTAVERDAVFWPAEDYHQNYHNVNPIRYKAYRFSSGRDAFIDEIWGARDDFEIIPNAASHQWVDFKKPSTEELRTNLSELSYRVTQEDGTEPPRNEGNHDNNYEAGIYVDIVSGEPLFSSADKFDSGTGWPSFTKPITGGFTEEISDNKFFIHRTEVRSRYADSHLGHLFNDGPEPTGERWCINGASLSFVPYAQMAEQGYEDYMEYVK